MEGKGCLDLKITSELIPHPLPELFYIICMQPRYESHY